MNGCGAFSTYVQLDSNQIYLLHIHAVLHGPYDENIHTVSVFLCQTIVSLEICIPAAFIS